MSIAPENPLKYDQQGPHYVSQMADKTHHQQGKRTTIWIQKKWQMARRSGSEDG